MNQGKLTGAQTGLSAGGAPETKLGKLLGGAAPSPSQSIIDGIIMKEMISWFTPEGPHQGLTSSLSRAGLRGGVGGAVCPSASIRLISSDTSPPLWPMRARVSAVFPGSDSENGTRDSV